MVPGSLVLQAGLLVLVRQPGPAGWVVGSGLPAWSCWLGCWFWSASLVLLAGFWVMLTGSLVLQAGFWVHNKPAHIDPLPFLTFRFRMQTHFQWPQPNPVLSST